MLSSVKNIFLLLIISALTSACASYQLDLNIDQTTAQELPKEIAVNYLREINEKYPINVQSRYLEPWDANCRFSEDSVWLVTVPEKYPYDGVTMHYYIIDNPGFQQLSITLNVGDEICHVVMMERRDNPENSRKLFIETGKKIATALKSLGAKIKE